MYKCMYPKLIKNKNKTFMDKSPSQSIIFSMEIYILY